MSLKRNVNHIILRYEIFSQLSLLTRTIHQHLIPVHFLFIIVRIYLSFKYMVLNYEFISVVIVDLTALVFTTVRTSNND